MTYIYFCLLSFSVVSDSATPWAVARQLHCPRNFPGKHPGVGCYFLFQGGLPDPGIELQSPASPALAGRSVTTEPPRKSKMILLFLF